MNQDVGVQIKIQAAAVLARLDDSAAIPTLGRALEKNPLPEVRNACAQALGRMSGDGAIDALYNAASLESDVMVRIELVHALASKGRRALASLARIAESDKDAKIRELAKSYCAVLKK